MNTALLQLFEKEPEKLTLAEGKDLFEVGAPADGRMYVMLSGQAEILVGDLMVELAEPGAILGEMALIDPQPRSATVHCVAPCTFAVIDARRFQTLIQMTPAFALEVMRAVVQRLRRTDKML
jgi:CRP-like cAMP-binding protein